MFLESLSNPTGSDCPSVLSLVQEVWRPEHHEHRSPPGWEDCSPSPSEPQELLIKNKKISGNDEENKYNKIYSYD